MQYYHLAVWAQGQLKWAKVAQKFSTYDVTPITPNQKLFSLQTTRLAESFSIWTAL